MWVPTTAWWEFVLRAVLVYLFLLSALRLTGRRQVGQLAPFDLVLLLVISNAVQNSMNAGDNSLTGGLVSAATLIAINAIVGRLTYQNKTLEALVEGRPQIIVHDGEICRPVMRKEQISFHELKAALRDAGCASINDVHYAILENTGHITVLPRKRPTEENREKEK